MNAAITVNGVGISEQQVLAEMQHHPAPDADSARHRAAVALITRELLRQEAERLGIEVREDEHRDLEEARIEALLAHVLQAPAADEASCRRYYESNAGRFRTPTLYGVRHILVALPADAPRRVAETTARRTAERIIAELQAHPDRFAELAARHSICPSKDQGGALGQIGPGQTVPEFEQALERFGTTGLIPEPVESRYGLHVIHVDRCIDGEQLPFEAVHRRIADYLVERSHREAARQFLDSLLAHADVQGIALP